MPGPGTREGAARVCLVLFFLVVVSPVRARSDPSPPSSDSRGDAAVDLLLDPILPVVASPGFGAALRVGSIGERVQLGISLQSGHPPDAAKPLLVDATVDPSELEVDWEYAVAVEVHVDIWRHGRFTLFARSSIGYERWRISRGTRHVHVANNFLGAGPGARWFPIPDVGFMVEWAAETLGLIGQEDAYALGEETVELQSWIPIYPTMRIGYRF